jgi:Flp pilus assembly protein TadD
VQPKTTQVGLDVIENANVMADALFTQGKIQIRQEKYEDAIKSIRGAIGIDSSASEYHYYLSTALLKIGVKNEAAIEISKAIELSPENDEYRKLKII